MTVAREMAGQPQSGPVRSLGTISGWRAYGLAAVLGAIVNSSLISHLNSQLDKLGLGTLKGFVIPEVLHGGAAFTTSGGGRVASQATTPLAKKLLQSVYDAFYAGLHICLNLSAAIVLLAGVIAMFAMRHEPPMASTDDAVTEPSSGARL